MNINLNTLLKIKGWVTISAGFIFVFFQTPYSALILGTEFNEPGIIFNQLFGLMLIAVGWALTSSPNAFITGSKALVFSITDLIASAILIWAIQQKIFAPLTLSLVAIYLVSALIFIKGWISQLSKPSHPTQQLNTQTELSERS